MGPNTVDFGWLDPDKRRKKKGNVCAECPLLSASTVAWRPKDKNIIVSNCKIVLFCH
jgi:hypothetical protein